MTNNNREYPSLSAVHISLIIKIKSCVYNDDDLIREQLCYCFHI